MGLRSDLFLTQGNFNMNKINVVFPEDTKKYVSLQCNGNVEDYTCLAEIGEIEKYLKRTPRVALDVGSGIGRASVFFFKYFKWIKTLFILADGDSGNIQLCGRRTGGADFYNSLKATESFCRANGMEDFKTFNLEKSGWAKLPRKPDLVYSFKALGFHWPINPFLEVVYPALSQKCRLIFELRAGNPQSFEWTKRQIELIDRTKYEIAGLFLEADRKPGNFIVLEKK